jgi:hypothetical protein
MVVSYRYSKLPFFFKKHISQEIHKVFFLKGRRGCASSGRATEHTKEEKSQWGIESPCKKKKDIPKKGENIK